MSLFDELKGRAGALKDKAAGLVRENSDTIKGAVGNVGDYIDSKTDGKYSEQVDGLQAKASGFVDSFGGTGGQAPSDGNTSSNSALSTPWRRRHRREAAPAPSALAALRAGDSVVAPSVIGELTPSAMTYAAASPAWPSRASAVRRDTARKYFFM